MSLIFGNSTERSGWVDESNTRDTFGILSSCMATTVLCVWTALDLNIPSLGKRDGADTAAQGSGEKQAGFFLVCWLLIWSSIQRGISTQTLAKCYHVRRDSISSKEHIEPRSEDPGTKWTMVHALYAVMGEFVLKASAASDFLPGKADRMTLTGSGVRYMLEHQPNLLPHVTEDHIFDKSEPSAFAKTLVCIQVVWFILQCITRLAASLPISLLEVHFGDAFQQRA